MYRELSGGEGVALLADIGGTNARFALLQGGGIVARRAFGVAEFATPEAAIADYLQDLGVAPRQAAIAAAGPVAGGRAGLTNAPWELSVAGLRAACGFAQVLLVHDFAALAAGLPGLRDADLLDLGGGPGRAEAPTLVLGPGTGFGLACRLPDGPGPGGIVVGEGGHATLPAGDGREAALIALLRRRFGHVSIERVLSGSGLVALHAALAELDGEAVPPRDSPEAVTAAALTEDCPVAGRTLEAFLGFLGGVAGDAALSFGARGGVFLAGGVLGALEGRIAASPCRARFEAKGRFRDYMAAIPLRLIRHPEPAFLGLARLLEEA
jgi:glucokinase